MSNPKHHMRPTTRSSGRLLPAPTSVKKEETEVKKESPSSIVPYPGHPPVPVRYPTTIGPSRPNYQSALVTQYDPFKSESQSISQNPVNYRYSSPYTPRYSQHLFYIEPDLNHLKFPQTIAKAYFPPTLHFQPSHPSKTLKFYT